MKSDMSIHLDNFQDIGGFVMSNAEKDEQVEILTRASYTSDQPEFFKYIDQFTSLILSSVRITINQIYQFLLIIHFDKSADLYLNSIPFTVQILAKKDMKKGDVVKKCDVADIRSIIFENTILTKNDKVIFCFKVGWKFGLYFDLSSQRDLDINQMSMEMGALYRYLCFQEVYKQLETDDQFEDMKRDGWFPYIEIVGSEYDELIKIYQNRFKFEDRINYIVNIFDQSRIKIITNKWWSNIIFKNKQQIIEAGIEAFLNNDKSGFINCIKTLSTEVGGIIHLQFFQNTGNAHAGFKVLLEHIANVENLKTTEYSLFFPSEFLRFLQDVVFANFDIENDQIPLSRHSSSHGVAKSDDYTKVRALQMILILDQIYFYIQSTKS